MTSITIDEYAKKHVQSNPDDDIEDIKARLRKSLKNKNNGATCMICGSSIWALGSAVSGQNMCFSCLTGEADSSNDYEVVF